MKSLGRRSRAVTGRLRGPSEAPEEAAAPRSTAGSGARRRARRNKTFLLGMGCQKGGTTWLHRYLTESPQYARGYRKEYHVFDSTDLESEEWMRDRILRMAAEELDKARRGEECDAEQLHRASMYADERFYFDYFAGLLRSRRDYRLTADITPDYAMLSQERVAVIKKQFAKRRIRTVSVFLMRDPVERIWSHIRMQDQRQPERFDVPAEEVVARMYDAPVYSIRTQYHRTLDVMDSVFEPDEVWYGFYEELFQEGQIQQICRLAGIDYHEPDFDRRRNAYGKGAELPEEVVRTVAQHYREVYQGVARRFPDKDLVELWPSSRYVL